MSVTSRLSCAFALGRDIIEKLPVGVLTFRLVEPGDLVLVDENSVAATLFDNAVVERGFRLDGLWPPREAGRVTAGLLAAARLGAPYEDEVILRGDGGKVRQAFRVRGFSVPGQRVAVVLEDITKQRRAEESLAESEAKYRGLVEDLTDGVFCAGVDGVITYVSPAVSWILGYRPEEIVGRSYREFAPPGTLPSMGEVDELFATTPPSAPIDYPVLAKDGRTVWVRVSAHVVRDEAGKAVGLQGVFSDITSRRATEQTLEAARRDMELVLNATSDYLAYYTPDLTLRWVNRATAAAIGKPESEIVGRRCRDVWTCADQEGEECAVSRAAAMCAPCQSRVRTKRDQTFVVRAYPAFEEGRLVGVVESIVDVTASQRAREEKERVEAQLRQSQKLESIGTLASGIAHEVNNPLTGMVNYAELIADRVRDDRLREFAVGIQQEGARVAAIVRNLLSFARTDPGVSAAVRPKDIVDTTLMLFHALLERDGIEVRTEVSEDLPCVACRAQQIEQVLLNLLTNARDALETRYPERSGPDKWLALRGQEIERDDAAFVRLTVEDNGTGIPESIRDRVFDPFFTTKPRDRGTGLGLSISYGIVRDHGGRLWIEHAPASGGVTAVHVELPLAAPARDDPGAECRR